MSVREIYDKFDTLKRCLDLAEEELREKARSWNVEGTDMLDIINKLSF